MNLFQHWQWGWWKDTPAYSPGSSTNTSFPTRGWIKFLQSHEADGYETPAPIHLFYPCGKWKKLSPNQCSFQVTSISHQHVAGKRRIPELNNLESGLECVSPNLSSFLPLFQSFPVPPPSRAREDVPWSRRERVGLNPSSSSKAQLHPHMFTQDSVPSLVGKFSKSSHLGTKSLWKKLLSAYCAEHF